MHIGRHSKRYPFAFEQVMHLAGLVLVISIIVDRWSYASRLTCKQSKKTWDWRMKVAPVANSTSTPSLTQTTNLPHPFQV